MPDWDDDVLRGDEDTGDVPALDPELRKELERVSGRPPGNEREEEVEQQRAAPEKAEEPEPEAQEPATPPEEPQEPEEAEEPEEPDPGATEEWDRADVPEAPPEPPAKPRRTVVIGGGPAGAKQAQPSGAKPPAEPAQPGQPPKPAQPEQPSKPAQPQQTPAERVAAGVSPVTAAARAPAATAAPAAGDGKPPAEGGVPPGMTPLDVIGGDSEGDKPPRRLWLRFFTASFVVVVSFAAATSTSLLLYLSDIAAGLGRGADLRGVKNQLAGVEGGKPETILIIGSDIRPQDRKAHLPGRSDTTMLLRLDPDRNAIALLSIPRDLKVNVPGVGVAKFNEAYAEGGPRLTLRVVRQLTGLKVNHLVNVDFTGFLKAVNSIGCVYVDVDRRYYHSNIGLPASLQYDAINIEPGYQRMCGNNAIHYVRYRHTDTDLVRAARQHDFLREARDRISPAKLISDRHELLRIFTDYTSSDIDDPETMLQVLKLFLASRNAPIKEVHFPARIGRSYVTSSQAQIQKAVQQFLGIQATPGPRGHLPARLASKGNGSRGGASKQPKKAKKKKKGPKPVAPGLEQTSYGRSLAFGVQRKLRFPVFYPTEVASGSIFDQAPRPYTIIAPDDQPFRAYRFVMKTPDSDYYGLQGTTWTDPPLLESPSLTITREGRNYDLYFDGDRLRMVAWHTDHGSYWVANSLLEALTRKQMIGIATTVDRVRPHRKRHNRK